MQAIDWSNSVTIEEKYITLCIYKTGSVYFAEDRIMSCIKQGGVIRLTHEIYDKSSYDNNGYCILLNTNSCHFQHSYRYSDTRILDLIEDCYGQRECRPNIPQSYWDYPYSLFQKTQNCSDVEKHKIGIKIFYKCTDELSIITESSKSTKEYTEVPSSDSGSSEGYTGNRFLLYIVVAVLVTIVLLVAIVIGVVLYKRKFKFSSRRSNPYVKYISEQ